MYIAQPALSQHIRRLEHELGVQLFDRSARHVRLTPAGDAFLAPASRLLTQAEEAARRAQLARDGESGTVAIGVDVAAARSILPAALHRWSTRRPDVRPLLTAANRPELLDLLRRRELDLAVLDGPITEAAFSTHELVKQQALVLVPSGHRLAAREAIEPTELCDEPFVMLDRTVAPGVHDPTLALCVDAGFSPRVVLQVRDADLVPLTVAAAIGIAIVGSNHVSDRAFAGVEIRPLVTPHPLGSLVVAWVDDGATRQSREFTQLLIDLIPIHGRAAPRRLTAVG
jgi:DNA-binding transcriptional LysR family regulator